MYVNFFLRGKHKCVFIHDINIDGQYLYDYVGSQRVVRNESGMLSYGAFFSGNNSPGQPQSMLYSLTAPSHT